MSLVVAGLSYKTAAIALREAAAVPSDEMHDALQGLVRIEGVKEAAVLSTCNRVEVVLEAKTDRLGAQAADAFFRGRMGDAYDAEALYVERGDDAVHHLMRVVCSLDSQVLGEAQILGQVRCAYEQAQEAGTLGEMLTELLKRALHLGKLVRSETAIGSDSISISTVAHRVAANALDGLSNRRVLVVGSGDMARLLFNYLLEDGAGELLVTSRTSAHAASFARETGARAVAFADLHEVAATCDAVFAMTASETPVICAERLAAARREAGREDCQLVLVDEGLPRDIERACAELPCVELFDLEALTAIADDGLTQRMAAVPEVERLAEKAESSFLAWMQERLVTPTIKAIYEKGELTVAGELDRATRALEKERGEALTEAELQVLESYGKAIMKKLLHGPTIRLRKEAQTADSYYYTGAARYLFGIETFPPGTNRTCHMRVCEKGEPCPMGFEGSMKEACERGNR